MTTLPRLMLKCAYGLDTAAWVDEWGVKHLDISHLELERYREILRKKFKREVTMIEIFEYVKKAILQ